MYDKNIFDELPIYRVIESLKNPTMMKLAEASVTRADSLDMESFALRLRKAIGRDGIPFSTKIGTHPDFQNLKQGQSARAPTTSIFVDIKGSTQLFEKYDYEKAFLMQDSIIQSAIYIIQAFDGHIVRIPGDGIFAVFGRQDYSAENGMLDALNAASTMLVVLETHLKTQFESLGLNPLRIRVGIDFDEKALWKHNGIEGCHELSPHGLHVSLAAKLQNKAHSNRIMIGDAVKTHLALSNDAVSVKKYQEDGEEKAERFVRSDYKMWEFDWEKHSENFSWIAKHTGQLFPALPYGLNFTLAAAIIDENDTFVRKISSSMEVLEKGHSLFFSVVSPLPQNCKINWFVENHGDEASEADCLFYEIESGRNKLNVIRDTFYHGQHFLICKVTFPSGKVVEKRVGVFISPKFVATERDVTGTLKQRALPKASPHMISYNKGI
ncbi:MAG: adenylate/guanylate cyclase domain-containing protein [Bdellovibrionota bacterium]